MAARRDDDTFRNLVHIGETAGGMIDVSRFGFVTIRLKIDDDVVQHFTQRRSFSFGAAGAEPMVDFLK